MRKAMLIRCILPFLILFASAEEAYTAPGEIYAEIMSSPLSVSWLSPGHAFVCIAHHLNSGIKEECYGFYKSNKPDEVFVGAPSLSNESKKNPTRFSQISWELQKKISDDQYRAFYRLVGNVANGSHRLLNMNLRLPLKGGTSQWSNGGPWNNIYSLSPIFD